MIASYKKSDQEGEANIFAAGLLMPSFLFQNRIENSLFSIPTIKDIS